MTNIDNLRALLPPDDNSSDIRLGILLDTASSVILDLIGRDALPERLNDMVVQLALRLYGRLGSEGELKHTENDVSVTFSDLISDDMRLRLKNYPRKVRAVYAAGSENSQTR